MKTYNLTTLKNLKNSQEIKANGEKLQRNLTNCNVELPITGRKKSPCQVTAKYGDFKPY